MKTTKTAMGRVALALVLAAAAAWPAMAQELDGCPMLPRNNVWNTPIDNLPVHPLSEKFIETGGPDRSVHPDFSRLGGIPYNIVPANQPMVPIKLLSPESDPGPYPVPEKLNIEYAPPGAAEADNHGLILQQGTCKLYEIYQAVRLPDGGWQGTSGAVFDMRSNALRPDGWTSADAAGLPILPGLVRWDEIEAGEIRHAIRLTVPRTRAAYVWPARHFASRLGDLQYPPMGMRFRLKANYDISGFPRDVQVLLRALKKYGMILADNGSSWFLTGVPDGRWNDELWANLKRVKGSDLEAVDTSSLTISPNSGQAGSVSTIGQQEVSYSATPAFDLVGGSTQVIKLAGDVTGGTITGMIEGQHVSFVICQDDAGNRNFQWPANVRGGMRVGLTSRSCSAQTFVVHNGLLLATSPGSADLRLD